MDLRLAARAALAGELAESELEALWARAAARPRPLPGAARKHLGHASRTPSRRPEPERARRLERRRRVAAGGWLPPVLAASFTPGEAAVLSVIGCQVVRHGRCEKTVGELGDIAGVSRATVHRAVRRAVRLGLLDRRERRVAADRSLASVLTIASPQWLVWLRTRVRRGEGVRNDAPQNKVSLFSCDVEALSASRSHTIHRQADRKPTGAHLQAARCRPAGD